MNVKTTSKLIMLIAAIIVAALTVAGGVVFAWFASNVNAKGNLVSIGIIGRCYAQFSSDGITYTDIDSFRFDQIKCGGTVDIYIRLVNQDTTAYSGIDIYFGDPAVYGRESAYTDSDGSKHYFGAQVGISQINDADAGFDSLMLLTLDGDDNIMSGNTYIDRDITIGAAETVNYKVTLLFADNADVNQNIFNPAYYLSEEGVVAGYCSRSVIVEYTDD